MDHHSLTAVKLEMTLRAVDNSDTSYYNVETTIESQCLHQSLTCGILSNSTSYCWKYPRSTIVVLYHL
uniref:Uncharacterized protein n=1 Tax=Oryza rufipogon TaxID=4529 RepID=A0A0E0MZS4_ORYRU